MCTVLQRCVGRDSPALATAALQTLAAWGLQEMVQANAAVAQLACLTASQFDAHSGGSHRQSIVKPTPRTCVSDSSLVFTGCLRSARRPSSARPCSMPSSAQCAALKRLLYPMTMLCESCRRPRQRQLGVARKQPLPARLHLLCCVASLGLLGCR